MFDNTAQIIGLLLPFLFGYFHNKIVHLTRFGIDFQNKVRVKTGHVFEQIVNNRRFEQNAVYVAVVDQNAHRIDLMAEHVAAGIA